MELSPLLIESQGHSGCAVDLVQYTLYVSSSPLGSAGGFHHRVN